MTAYRSLKVALLGAGSVGSQVARLLLEHGDELAARARALAATVVERLDAVGVLCVELFVTTAGELLVNELAPRPHNSGHLTIEAAPTSQFEQQLRAVCGASTSKLSMRG